MSMVTVNDIFREQVVQMRHRGHGKWVATVNAEAFAEMVRTLRDCEQLLLGHKRTRADIVDEFTLYGPLGPIRIRSCTDQAEALRVSPEAP